MVSLTMDRIPSPLQSRKSFDLQFMISLESKASLLMKKFGARECSCCSKVKIDCAPFFLSGNEYCADCGETLRTNTSVGLVC